MKITRFTPQVLLLATLVWVAGCVAPKPTPNPLVGWKAVIAGQPNITITKDYQDYIQQLPPEERKFVGSLLFFEDGTGQHALKIEIDYYGVFQEHVLIYDKDDKRIKVIIYSDGRYRS